MPSKKPAKSRQACYLLLAGFFLGLLTTLKKDAKCSTPEKSEFPEKHGVTTQSPLWDPEIR
jgi:hypothetical protein